MWGRFINKWVHKAVAGQRVSPPRWRSLNASVQRSFPRRGCVSPVSFLDDNSLANPLESGCERESVSCFHPVPQPCFLLVRLNQATRARFLQTVRLVLLPGLELIREVEKRYGEGPWCLVLRLMPHYFTDTWYLQFLSCPEFCWGFQLLSVLCLGVHILCLSVTHCSLV